VGCQCSSAVRGVADTTDFQASFPYRSFVNLRYPMASQNSSDFTRLTTIHSIQLRTTCHVYKQLFNSKYDITLPAIAITCISSHRVLHQHHTCNHSSKLKAPDLVSSRYIQYRPRARPDRHFACVGLATSYHHRCRSLGTTVPPPYDSGEGGFIVSRFARLDCVDIPMSVIYILEQAKGKDR